MSIDKVLVEFSEKETLTEHSNWEVTWEASGREKGRKEGVVMNRLLPWAPGLLPVELSGRFDRTGLKGVPSGK